MFIAIRLHQDFILIIRKEGLTDLGIILREGEFEADSEVNIKVGENEWFDGSGRGGQRYHCGARMTSWAFPRVVFSGWGELIVGEDRFVFSGLS